MSNRVLVFGASGQVGSQTVKRSIDGLELIGLDHRQADITSSDSIRLLFDQLAPDIVVNAAAYTAVDQAEVEKETAYAINNQGASLLAELCVAAEVPLIHLSTDYIFDGLKGEPYREEDPAKPLNNYGLSKLAGEASIREVLDQHIILRTSGIFSGTHDCFPRTILRAAKDHRELQVVDDQFGNPTSAGAAAHVVLEIIRLIVKGTTDLWGTYHFAQYPDRSWYQFATEILCYAKQGRLEFEEVSVTPVSTSQFGSKAARPLDSRLDSRKLMALMPLRTDLFEREIYLEETVKKILRDIC